MLSCKLAIPTRITQGDRVTWSETVADSDNAIDLLTFFVRGQFALDLTGVPDVEDKTQWHFEIIESTASVLAPGIYHAQLVLFSSGFGKQTLGVTPLEVEPSFELLTSLDTRSSEEKELAELEKAIAQLSNGVQEYYIGTRRVRYADLNQLYERQKYLKNRIAKMKRPRAIGGRNVGVRIMHDY